MLHKNHPALGLLFSGLSSFPIPYDVAIKLENIVVPRSRLLAGELQRDPRLPTATIDNGFRLLQITKKIIAQVGMTDSAHSQVAEMYFHVGFFDKRP